MHHRVDVKRREKVSRSILWDGDLGCMEIVWGRAVGDHQLRRSGAEAFGLQRANNT